MTKTVFFRDGRTFRAASADPSTMVDVLPPGNYVVKQDLAGLYLEQADDFTLPKKLYGDTRKNAQRILDTAMSREASTGVLLSGIKGCGKTELARTISVEGARQLDMPTIIVNRPFPPDMFSQMIQDIRQDCIVLFDEFEKNFDQEHQPHLLTLLDGVFPTKKLWVLTCNDKHKIDAHMHNRPGRLFYSLDFEGLSQAFIAEYCQDNLANKDQIINVQRVAGLFDHFSFDHLKALVEEMNRYDETAQEALHLLNVKPFFESRQTFDVAIELNRAAHKIEVHDSQKVVSPLTEGRFYIQTEIFKNEEEVKADDGEGYNAWFTPADITKSDTIKGVYTFKNQKGDHLTLTRRIERRYNAFDAL